MDIETLKGAYERDGYAVAERFLPDDLVAELRSETEHYVTAAREGRLTGPQFDIIETGTGPELRRITDPEAVSPVYDRAMRCKPLVDLLADLLDGTVRFDHGKLNVKPPSGGGALDWHQD